MIEIYTDGSCRGNPGPGGYGVVMKYGTYRKELSAGFKRTTNNRMELMAVIVALKHLKTNDVPITLYSDSKYVIDSINKRWVYTWEKKNFVGRKNSDLWRMFLRLNQGMNITYKWVKGHAGNTENERCDTLAVESAIGNDLGNDVGFN